MTMGLRRGETWDDYINKEVFVSTDFCETGFDGILIEWDKDKIVVKHKDTGELHECKHGTVFGEWWFDDW
jgi:hypothetical protein